MSFQNTTTLATGLSDFHKMIVTVCKTSFQKPKPKEVVYRNYKKFDRDIFKDELKLKLESITNYESFEDVFLTILNKHAPLKKKVLRSNQAPYMTKALRKDIMRRSELESKYFKNKTNENKARFKKQKIFCSKLYKKERKKFYSNLELNEITDNKLFWKTIKPILSEKCIQSSKISFVSNNKVISEDLELAKTFNNYFGNAVNNLGIKECEFELNVDSNCNYMNGVDIAIHKFKDHPSIKMINEKVRFESRFSFKEVSNLDIEREISHLNTKKVGTFGNIPTKVLKESSNVCNSTLKDIWNYEILGKQNFSKNLKLADITPVYKKKDPTLVENCRPVSVIPSVSKVFERIIQKQFSSFIDEFLSPFLCGYRQGFNTQYALLSLIEKWKNTLDNKGYTGAVLMDLSKAFDTINHELLIAKLHAYGFSKQALKILFSYMSDRWQRTKINKSFSSWFSLLQGVQQGSVLVPILFNIYLNDLFYFLSCNVCNFADDTTPYVCNKNLEFVPLKLEEQSNIAINWFENNYMKMINVIFLSQVTNMSMFGPKSVMIEFGKLKLLNFWV